MKLRPYLLAFVLIFGADVSAQSQGGDWRSLFDGKTLSGWTQKNGTATYRVEDGTIVGRTAVGSPNSFLCTEQEYGDFELEFEVKVDVGLNSGVQVRSKTKEKSEGEAKNDQAGRVYGPQVEIESSPGEAGYIYGEATGYGWLTPKDRLKAHEHFKNDGWNTFRVVARGARIETWINGEKVEDLTHQEIYRTHPRGFIGLQVHGIREGQGPFQVAWRNLRLRELK